MSERDEFEAWAGRNFLDVTRNRGMVIDYVKPDTQLAWLAWQAARAPQAVPALTEPIYQWRGNSIDNWTDCAKETYDNIGLTLERYPADQPTPTWERRIVYAAPQPSPEPKRWPCVGLSGPEDWEMSERDEFEAWAKREGYGDQLGEFRELDTFAMDYAWKGFQAARAPQAVQALTDEQILLGVAEFADENMLANHRPDILRCVRAILAAAPQPSPRPAVPALTDEQRKVLEVVALDYETRGFTNFPRVLRSILAAPQPSPEALTECAEIDPEAWKSLKAHAHDWRFSLQDHVYKCDCGATRGDYPFGAASFKD